MPEFQACQDGWSPKAPFSPHWLPLPCLAFGVSQHDPTSTLLAFFPQSRTFFHGLGHTFFQSQLKCHLSDPLPTPGLANPLSSARHMMSFASICGFTDVFMFDGLSPSTMSSLGTGTICVCSSRSRPRGDG